MSTDPMREAMEAYLSERCSGPACSDPMHARFRAALALPETTPAPKPEGSGEQERRAGRAAALVESMEVAGKLTEKTDCEIARLLLDVWSDMDMTSPQAVIVAEAISRIDPVLADDVGGPVPAPAPAPAPEETMLERLAGKWGVYLAAPDGYLDSEHLRLALEEAYRLGAASRPAPSEPAAGAVPPFTADEIAFIHEPASGGPEVEGPDERLRAFREKYEGDVAIYSLGPAWFMEWTRTYRDARSDKRSTTGPSLAAVIRQAEDWEAENDRRDPQHAAGLKGKG